MWQDPEGLQRGLQSWAEDVEEYSGEMKHQWEATECGWATGRGRSHEKTRNEVLAGLWTSLGVSQSSSPRILAESRDLGTRRRGLSDWTRQNLQVSLAPCLPVPRLSSVLLRKLLAIRERGNLKLQYKQAYRGLVII